MRSLGPREGHHQPESPREGHRESIQEDASGATLRQIGRGAGLGEAVLVSQDGAIPPRDPLGLQGPIPSSYTASVLTGLPLPHSRLGAAQGQNQA